ncbi:NADH dehydrogenase [Niastella yeongjuensis]|uniref:NADH:ubiquinone reductase (non-electrogenic) n=1 Tax=Niastella yeongjuensis TaxID=354355 RepID=A0A1V9EWN9_9BACT|nr:NAD(P)/FAD-dependent oxidoreductase [Niastella yeongjuensis]OQP50325.1 NADH dehydrogenase [Niastella yeongjuensis]SEN39552.1 NADH dehydrogenase [Niastella yeongjuensis]
MEQPVKKVVIVGGGFAGINLIKHLSKDSRFHITLVDKNNYSFFPPLLYQVATAFIEPSNISYPFRRLFQKKTNLRFHMGSLLKVNPEQNTIETDTGVVAYDYLVLAVGTESNYFGMERVKANSLPMKSIDDALNLRNHLLLNMEEAVHTDDLKEKEKHLNIVICGGGPTGVELAGMLAELGRNIALKEYPEIKDLRSHLYLIDAGKSLLGPMSEKSQNEATRVLKKLGVHVINNTAVKDYHDDIVVLSDGRTIPTKVLIWASGVTGREIPGLPTAAIGRGRRVLVDEANKAQGSQNIFAIGDICLQTTDTNFPGGHPQLAQVAIQQGTKLAKNLIRAADNKPMEAFAYRDKGSMAIISKYKAVCDIPPKGFFKGFPAWLVWLFIHIIPLIGFRNKVKLAFSWFWSFITNDPTLRLIIRPRKQDVH